MARKPRGWGVSSRPEKHYNRYRVRVRPPGRKAVYRSFETFDEAQGFIDGVRQENLEGDAYARAAEHFAAGQAALAEAEAAGLPSRKVRDALDAYRQHRRDSKRVKRGTIQTEQYRLRALLSPLFDHAVVQVLDREAQAAYAERCEEPGLSPATHQNELAEVRRLWRWLIAETWVTANPWEHVKGRGVVPRGKAQLSADEAKMFLRTALERARRLETGRARDESRRLGGLAAILAVTLGLRASEIIGLRARWCTDDGTINYMPAKRRLGDRRMARVQIPERLEDVYALLLDHAARITEIEGPEGLLFPYREAWPRAAVAAVCQAAGVPVITAHGMRGTHASLAVRGGATAEEVAQQLNHSGSAVTRAHYIDGAAEAQANLDRAAGALLGEDNGDDEITRLERRLAELKANRRR